MGVKLTYRDEQTPLDDDERGQLLNRGIIIQAELNEAEQLNIEKAIEWTLKKKFGKAEVFTEKYILDLHKRMFGDVWKWAGTYRRSEKNPGVSRFRIGVSLRSLLDDALYWIENKVYEEDEIAIRFKHRLVGIHCFPNGNGRHSRLMADIIITHIFGKPVFTWASRNLAKAADVRSQYINAMKQGDRGNFMHLVQFARS